MADLLISPAETDAIGAPLDASDDPVAAGGDAKIAPVPGVSVLETTLIYQKLKRRVVYLKPTASSSTNAPMFVLLHYHHGSPEKMENLTRASRLVAMYGAWVVLPEAHNKSWNFNPGKSRKVDDSGFLAQVIDNMVASFPVDPRRVYMAGFSQGGFMTERFLCEHSERIAAAVWSSAELVDTEREVCHPQFATPVMTFHGTQDRRVGYNGRLGVSSAPDTAAFFAGLNGCGATPVRTSLPDSSVDGTTVVLDTYGSCSSSKPVNFYTVNGGGHTWPGNDYQTSLLGRTTHDIDATLLLYSFATAFQR